MTTKNTDFDTSLAESLQDIGERLRIIRLQQELDVKAIAKRTNIPAKHVTAIEAGNLETLPELVYIRGFIRRYAEALNQDVAAFDLGSIPMQAPTFQSGLPQPKMTLGAWMRKLQYPLYGLLVVAVGSGLVYLNNRNFSPVPAQSANETPVVSQTSAESDAN